MTKLQCSWSAPVDIDGLNAEDKARIQKIGLRRWIEEVAKAAVRTSKPSRYSLEYKQQQARKRHGKS